MPGKRCVWWVEASVWGRSFNSRLTNNSVREHKLLEFEFYKINSNFLKMVPDDRTTGWYRNKIQNSKLPWPPWRFRVVPKTPPLRTLTSMSLEVAWRFESLLLVSRRHFSFTGLSVGRIRVLITWTSSIWATLCFRCLFSFAYRRIQSSPGILMTVWSFARSSHWLLVERHLRFVAEYLISSDSLLQTPWW